MELVISDFNDEVQKKIFDKLNTEYLSTGKYVKDQVNISPKILSSLMLSGGMAGTMASAAVSSKLYMATADPATLMKIGNGITSTVVGASGKIVGAAPFKLVASSVPVVAPLMAMQVLNSVVMLQQFDAMDKKLDAIKGSIDKMIARQETTKIAELFAAVQIADEIYLQYGQSGSFSTDMLIRLALAERDASILSRRYEMLEKSETDSSTNEYANIDTYCTILASFLNLRIKYLRTSVDIQENPQFVKHSSENFKALLKNNIELWDEILKKPDKMKHRIDELEAEINNTSTIQKYTIGSKDKELMQLKEEYNALLENDRIILKDFLTLIDTAKQLSEATGNETHPTLLYWHDDNGEHCVATNDDILSAA